MNIRYSTPAGVGVELSRRNLEHLLKALDDDRPGPYLIREITDAHGETRTLTVYAQEDDEHYDDRKPGPGFEFLDHQSSIPTEVTDLPGISGLRVHAASVCDGEPCCIHNPSDHPLKEALLNWRPKVAPFEIGLPLMERICGHGIGHPDPDHIHYVRQVHGDKAADAELVHGCDGCCTGDAS